LTIYNKGMLQSRTGKNCKPGNIMKTLITILILIPFLSFGQNNNPIDKYGQKQFDTVKPRYIEQKLVNKDTSIINNTDLKVYKLFDTRDSINDFLKYTDCLFGKIEVCINQYLTIHIRPLNFCIKQNGIDISETVDTTCSKKINYHIFECNRIITEHEDGNIDVSYELEKKYFTLQIGKIEVERKQMRCDDTGYNPITIARNNKTLYFKDIGNLIFFEFDTNKDGINELYILNYFSCMGHLEIYKITNK
jgi:hypothetical protein